MILVTGGAGFIGANFILGWLAQSDEPVVNVDALTYAGHRKSLASLDGDARHVLVHGDVTDRALLDRLLLQNRPRAVVHFAAESHVDRSIHGPAAFLHSNIQGTFTLLEATLAYWRSLADADRTAFRFHHISTDEVYGSLSPGDPPAAEERRYAPSSPYSASKAASDHLVRAWYTTYGLPVLTTTCSNNHGPYHSPEKLIPLMIVKALAAHPLPVYGDGLHVRDWLHVEDHCAAVRHVLARGVVGETYNVGGGNERTNLDVVRTLCALLDDMRPDPRGSHARLITHVADRPGHDRRYALDTAKIRRELDWQPAYTFDSGLRQTVAWYLDHPEWVEHVQGDAHHEWLECNYTGRA